MSDYAYSKVPFPGLDSTSAKWHPQFDRDPRTADQRMAVACVPLEALVLLWWDEAAAHVEFAIFSVRHFGFVRSESEKYGPAVNTVNHPDAWEIEKIDSSHSMDTTTKIAEADCTYEGWIKFDGCANYLSPAAKDCMPHHCGLDGFTMEALVWSLVYYLADKIMRCEWHDPIFPRDTNVTFTEVALEEAIRAAHEPEPVPASAVEPPPQSTRSYEIWRSEK